MREVSLFSTLLMICMVCLSLASPASADSLWDHNGSVMRLVPDGDRRQMFYEQPKPLLRDAGVTEGTLLFDGYRSGNKYTGTARRFSKNCTAPLPYEVTGSAIKETTIVLRGRREVYDDNCRPTGRFTSDTLIFKFLHSALPVPTPQPPPTVSEQPAPTEGYTTTGTGFTVSNDGYVLTNRHVVDECGAVSVHDRGAAIVKEVDETNDLALLKMQGSTVAATFGSTSPSLGESVFALGFPYSGVLGAGMNFTAGNVSSLSGIRNDTRYFQFTAPIQPGNSGGPLVDGNGLVVGVVSARLADIEMLKASGSLPQNVNFAIRGDLARGFLRANGVEPVVGEPKSPLSTSEIASNGQAYTVQVVCQPTR